MTYQRSRRLSSSGAAQRLGATATLPSHSPLALKRGSIVVCGGEKAQCQRYMMRQPRARMLKIDSSAKRMGAGLLRCRRLLAFSPTASPRRRRDRAVSLALRVIADRIDNGEPLPEEAHNLFAA